MIRAGQLRRRVVIQTATAGQDAHGGKTHTWVNSATRWASVEPLSGSELVNTGQLESRRTHRIRMRFYAGLTTDHRISYDSRTFGISAVINPFEMDAELELLCYENATGANP